MRNGPERAQLRATGLGQGPGQDNWLDTDALRAAWLVVLAAVVADVIPDDAPKALRHDAHQLRAALGLPTEAPSGPKRALSAVGGLIGGTTLKFGVGPATFEAKLPDGARSTGSFLDAGTLLRDVDRLLAKTDQRVLVLLDRIDETFKYDRIRQEALIQARPRHRAEALGQQLWDTILSDDPEPPTWLLSNLLPNLGDDGTNDEAPRCG